MNTIIKSNFKKIRIRKNPKRYDVLSELFIKKEELMMLLSRAEKLDDDTEANKITDEVEDILTRISVECAKENENALRNISKFLTDPKDRVNKAKIWKLKQNLIPKNCQEPPIAKRDKNGNVVRGKKQIKNILVDTYKQRLSPNEMEQSLSEIEELKETLHKLRLENAKKNKDS